jgi:hypothetical protein
VRRKCPGLKHITEAMDGHIYMFVVEEHRIRIEAVPGGAVDCIRERMLA